MAKVKSTEASNTSRAFSSASTDKVLLILEFLTKEPRPLRLQEIADELSMTRPTVLRYLNSLVELRYIVKDEDTMRYSPTYKVCQLSHNVLTRITLRDIAAPFLRDLSSRLNCNVTIARAEEDELLYLDAVYRSNTAIGSVQRIGKNAPMHCTGSGKLFLASMSEENLQRFVQRSGLPQLTDKTITDINILREELAHIRSVGYAVDNEECETGFRCVSVPLYDYTDRLAAAISVFSTVDEFNMSAIENEIVPVLMETSGSVSSLLGASDAAFH